MCCIFELYFKFAMNLHKGSDVSYDIAFNIRSSYRATADHNYSAFVIGHRCNIFHKRVLLTISLHCIWLVFEVYLVRFESFL